MMYNITYCCAKAIWIKFIKNLNTSNSPKSFHPMGVVPINFLYIDIPILFSSVHKDTKVFPIFLLFLFFFFFYEIVIHHRDQILDSILLLYSFLPFC